MKFDKGGGGDPIPLEFNSLSGSVVAIKEDFLMAELDNSLRYFTALFGIPIRFWRRVSPFSIWTGFSDVAHDSDDRARNQIHLRFHCARDRASMVGRHRLVAIVSRSMAERGICRVFGNSLHREREHGDRSAR